jgi:hypothetical protein
VEPTNREANDLHRDTFNKGTTHVGDFVMAMANAMRSFRRDPADVGIPYRVTTITIQGEVQLEAHVKIVKPRRIGGNSGAKAQQLGVWGKSSIR